MGTENTHDASEFDREFVIDSFRPLTDADRARWESVKANPKEGSGMALEFSHAVTLDEYRSAVRLRLRRMRTVAYLVSALCLLATLAFLWIDPLVAVGAATGSASLALVASFVGTLSAPWEYRRSGLSGKTFSVLADPDWIAVSGVDGEAKTRWQVLRELQESKDVFLLCWQGGVCSVIPKRYLSGQQQDEFRALAGGPSAANQTAGA